MKNFCFGNCISSIRQNWIGKLNKKSKSEGSRFKQYIAAISACISIAVCGAGQTWPSPAIPHLTSKNSTFPVTDAQAVWIISLYNVGDLVGVLLNPLFIDRIGRKSTLLLSALPNLLGWGLIIFAENYIYLYVARLISGIGQGSTINSLVIYLTEISEKEIRGSQVNILHMGLSLGIFLFATIAAFTSYQILNISSASLLIIFLLIFSFSPETPYYYLLRERNDDALKCLMNLRGIDSSEKLEAEMRTMKLAIEEDRKNTKNFAFWELFSKSYNRKGMTVMFVMKVTQMMTGVVPIVYNAEEILSHNNLPIKPGIQVAIWHGLALPASLITYFIIDRMNRNVLFLSSGVLTTICLAAIGFFFFMINYLHRDASSYGWLPLVSLILFQMVYTIGIGNIPFIVQGELFPIRVKGSAVCLGRIISDVFGFATASGYKILSDTAGVYTTFWIFAVSTLIGSLVAFWITPNTTGMSLEEIQALQNPDLGEKLELEREREFSTGAGRRRCG